MSKRLEGVTSGIAISPDGKQIILHEDESTLVFGTTRLTRILGLIILGLSVSEAEQLETH